MTFIHIFNIVDIRTTIKENAIDKKQIRNLIAAAEKWPGWRVEEKKSGWMIYPPDKTQPGVLIHKTPSDHRAWANTVAQLKRVGSPL